MVGFLFFMLLSCAEKNNKAEKTTPSTSIKSSMDMDSDSSMDMDSRYKNAETKRVIEKMIAAHRGLEKWKSKPSFSYTNTYIHPSDPSDPWTSDEIVENGRRRVFQNWPLDKAQVIYDGKGYYGVNWIRGNPPKFTAHLAFYFSNLPWVTQDPGVMLGEVRKKKILNEPKEYLAVKMTFGSGTGESSDDYYNLLIDPETYTLRGIEYIMAYGAILDAFELPKDVKFLGSFIKKMVDYETVDGLKMFTKLITFGPKGEDYGYHTYKNWNFSKTFEDKLVTVPSNAIEDTSSSKMKRIIKK